LLRIVVVGFFRRDDPFLFLSWLLSLAVLVALIVSSIGMVTLSIHFAAALAASSSEWRCATVIFSMLCLRDAGLSNGRIRFALGRFPTTRVNWRTRRCGIVVLVAMARARERFTSRPCCELAIAVTVT